MTQTQKTALSFLLLALAPPTILLVAFDYAASYLESPTRAPDRLPQVEYFEFDPLQMWRLRPGFSGGQIRITPDGFRTPLPPPSENRRLVFLIGGSSVFGIGMPEEKTIAYFLQQLSDRLQPEKRLWFINAGVTGYYSTQEFIHLQRHVLPYHPAMVIALSGRNDAFYGLHPQFQPDAIPYHGLLRQPLGALDPYYTALESPRRSLHILNWLRSRRKNVPFDWLRDFKPVHLTYKPAATAVFLRNMNSAHALLTGQSIEFRLWLQPTIRVPQRTLDVQEQGMIGDFYLPALDQAYGELARECSARLPASWFRGFLSISRHRGQMFIDNVHFSEDGAREVAREIYSDIYDPIRISRIEMAREQNAILLGRGWRARANGLRWISDEATVEMSCPASGGGARLLLDGQSGPRPIELQVYAGDRVLYKQRMPADQAVKIGLPVESSLCASPFEVRLRALSGEAGQPALGVRSLEVQSLESH